MIGTLRRSPFATSRTMLLAASVAVTLGACSPNASGAGSGVSVVSTAETTPQAPTSQTTPAPSRARTQQFGITIVDRVVYDESFSQGLEYVDGRLVESVGGRGSSTVRVLDPSAAAPQSVRLEPALFVTGIAAVPAAPAPATGLWQMTWQDHLAILRDPTTLAELRRVTVDGEGWGLCHDGTRLLQSRGDNRLLFRDPVSFAQLGEVVVAGQWSTARLGELECAVVDGRPQVWANPQGTDWLLRIDPADGVVTAVVDLGRLAVEEIPTRVDQVIGGVAAIPQATGEFWVTGRGWAHRYRIRLQPRP